MERKRSLKHIDFAIAAMASARHNAALKSEFLEVINMGPDSGQVAQFLQARLSSVGVSSGPNSFDLDGGNQGVNDWSMHNTAWRSSSVAAILTLLVACIVSMSCAATSSVCATHSR